MKIRNGLFRKACGAFSLYNLIRTAKLEANALV